jgi:predicted translin family RNA/ssDNA-binding protein
MNKELAEHYFYISPEQYGRLYKQNQELKKQRDKAVAIAEELKCHCSGEMFHGHVANLEKLKKKIKKLDTFS